MSRVLKPCNKYMNIPRHESKDISSGKVRISHIEGADYHKSTSFKSWLTLKHGMKYTTYRNKTATRRHSLRAEYEQDTGRVSDTLQLVEG